MRMDVEEWVRRHQRGEYWHVFLDGEDVTRQRVILADEERGYVEVYQTDAQGRIRTALVDGRMHPLKDVRVGRVELRLDGEPVPEVTRGIRVRPDDGPVV